MTNQSIPHCLKSKNKQTISTKTSTISSISTISNYTEYKKTTVKIINFYNNKAKAQNSNRVDKDKEYLKIILSRSYNGP